MLPPVWIDAALRNTTPVCPVRGRIGLGFDVPGQPTPTIRLALTVEDAKDLQEDLARFIAAQAATESVAGQVA